LSVFHLVQGDIPTWYELAAPKGHLEIRVHKAAFDFLRLEATASRFSDVDENLQLPPFIEPTEERWGFGEILSITSREEDWTTLQCELPVIFKDRRSDPDWPTAYAVCATLGVLFDYLAVFEGDTGSDRKQLLGVFYMGMGVVEEKARGIGVNLSPILCSWLERQVGGEEGKLLGEITAAMLGAYQHMYRQVGAVDERDFPAFIRTPRRLHMFCPSGACGLETNDLYDGDPNYGNQLVPHNMDSALQQLTLLTGVAALCEMVRRDGC
jgi:hypothetical protein